MQNKQNNKMNKDSIIVAHINRQQAKKDAEFRRGVADALALRSYVARGYIWQQGAYSRGYLHGRYLSATRAHG